MFRPSVRHWNFAVSLCVKSLSFLPLIFRMVWRHAISALHLNIPTICAMLKHFLSLTHIFSSTPVSDNVRGNLFISFLYVYFFIQLAALLFPPLVYTAPIPSLSLFASCYAILQLPCFLFWYFHFFFPRRENLIFDEKSLHECKSSGTGESEQCVCKNTVTEKYSLVEDRQHVCTGSSTSLCFAVFSFRIPLCVSCLLLQPSRIRWLLRFDLIWFKKAC